MLIGKVTPSFGEIICLIYDEVLKKWSDILCLENLAVEFKKALNINDKDMSIKLHKNGNYLEIPDPFNEILEAMGYLKGADYRCKYLKPFICVQEGLETIKKEILAVRKIWDSAGLQ